MQNKYIFYMKPILSITLGFLLSLSGMVNAQLLGVGATPGSYLEGSNFFLDASLFNTKPAGIGRLLGFPQTNLTQFAFDTNAIDYGFSSNTYFDGVLVYNTASGFTKEGVKTPVSRGFYYFSNPNGLRRGDVVTGKWTKMGGTDFTSTETDTGNTIDGKPIYSLRSTFTIPAGNTNTSVSFDLPATGITGIYKITIYNPTTSYYTDSVYSFTLGTPTATETPVTLVTGSPNISVVYPAGEYNYIIEYLK